MPSSSPIVHFQIATSDPEATQAFFQEVFGWDFSPGAGRIKANIDTGARLVQPNDIYPSGSLLQAPEGALPYTAIFIRVADMDGAVARAEALGAKVLVRRGQTAAGTHVSILTTPQGLTVGVVQL
ncbi:MAG TPA: VOC family protein [Dehalococcoidia bacterium]